MQPHLSAQERGKAPARILPARPRSVGEKQQKASGFSPFSFLQKYGKYPENTEQKKRNVGRLQYAQ